ncbi:MAG: hypothetical protein JRH20_31050 [Deltaproteobacteria bacterium]|nr:hypothetical protein [Deltaproteobacteria bacterium]
MQASSSSSKTEPSSLRFILTTSSAGYATVFSVDAGHRATPFYPETDPAVTPAPLYLETQGKHVLPGSVVLDSSAGTEHIVIVFSEKVFRRDRLHRKIVRLLKTDGARALSAQQIGKPMVTLLVQKVEKTP